MQQFFRVSILLGLFFSALPAQYVSTRLFSHPTRTAAYLPAFETLLYAGHVAAAPDGSVYLTALGSSDIFRINPADGLLEPFAGSGSATLAPGDRTPAILAGGLYTTALAVDGAGNLLVGGGYPVGIIYRVTPDRMFEIYAASPEWFSIAGLTSDASGNVYALIATAQFERPTRIVKVAPDRSIATVALVSADTMTGDAAGTLYIAAFSTGEISRIDPTGAITAFAQVDSPTRLATGPGGVLYVSQPNLQRVSRIAPDGSVTMVAGGSAPPVPGGAGVSRYSGDGGPAVLAGLVQPVGLAVNAAGELYIADGRLRKIDTGGIIHTVAGCACHGNGVPTFWAAVGEPNGMVSDSRGNVYFSDQSTHMVRRIAPDGIVTTVAGTGESGYSGDGGPAVQALLARPAGLALDSAGNLYIADEHNHRIRKVTPGGLIETVAGNGIASSSGDGGPATAGSLAFPNGVAVDSGGNLYIADTATHRIRRVTTDGTIRTIAGSDTPGLAGDGGPAVHAQLYSPRTLIFDPAGNLLIADSAAHVVRRITPAGIIERVAGTGQQASSGDGGPATAAALEAPWALAIDSAGRVLIGEGGRGGQVRAVDAAGIIRLVTPGLATGLAADPAGRIWITGAGNVTVATQTGLPFSLTPVISDGGITGGGMWQTSVVSPGEIVSIFGARLGPSVGMSGSISNGTLATTIAGTRVLFDGVASPLLYVSDSQINAVVPFAVAGKATVQAVVEAAGVRSNPVTLAAVPAAPQLFLASLGTLNAAASLNQDGTPNRPQNEAAAGTIVSLFGAGAGDMRPRPADGQVISGDLPRPILPVRASIGTRMLEVTYAGAAPGLVAGALQVNLRLPDDLLTGYYAVELRVGDAISGSALVFTKARE